LQENVTHNLEVTSALLCQVWNRGISQQRATTLTTGSTPPLGWLPLYSPHDQAGYPTTHSQEPYP